MSDYWLLAVTTVIVLGTSLLLRTKSQPPPAYIGDREDITALVRAGAIEKKAIWEVFDGLAKKYGTSTCTSHCMGINSD